MIFSSFIDDLHNLISIWMELHLPHLFSSVETIQIFLQFSTVIHFLYPSMQDGIACLQKVLDSFFVEEVS